MVGGDGTESRTDVLHVGRGHGIGDRDRWGLGAWSRETAVNKQHGPQNEASLRLFVSPAQVEYTFTSVIFNLKAGLALKICIQRVSLEFENRKRAK